MCVCWKFVSQSSGLYGGRGHPDYLGSQIWSRNFMVQVTYKKSSPSVKVIFFRAEILYIKST